MGAIIGLVVKSLFQGVIAVLALFFAGLLVCVLLQFVGLLKSVPFSYSLRNLIVRWRTTVLTALAFTLVVAMLTGMLAFVNGMDALTEGSGQPGNVIVLAEGATDEVFSDLGYGDITKLANEPCITRAEVRRGDKVTTEPLISWELYVLANQPVENAKPGGRQRRFIQVRGIIDPVLSGLVHNLPLHEGGQWFSTAGTQTDEKPYEPDAFDKADPPLLPKSLIQAVIGEGMARELGQDRGKKTLEPGDIFRLGPRRWVVVGVLKSGGSTFDSEIWANWEQVKTQFNKNTRTTAVIRTADAEAAKAAAKELTENFKSPSIKAQTETDYFASLNATNLMFAGAINFVAAVMAIGGVFGIMNTMFAAIAQRTKDIGILRILGYARWQILVSFFLESLLLALFGGLLGCAIGSLCHGWTASSIMSSGQGGGKSVVLKLVVDAGILGKGMGFAVLMGYLGGLLPALSAVRLKMLDSLR